MSLVATYRRNLAICPIWGLYLFDNRLSGNIPPELGNLKKLKELYLHENRLTGGIPLELGNLGSLRQFAVSMNDLTGPIPPELGNLEKPLGAIHFIQLPDRLCASRII